mgnify:CR=1 FL=1
MNSFFPIIIPIYKVENTLGKCVFSINNQFIIINGRFLCLK